MTEPVHVVVLKASWPLPSASPACLKLLTWLRMAGIAYEDSEPKGPPKSKTGKAPYIVRPDGTLLDDSSIIIAELTREHGVSLDAKRTAKERALMVLIQRTVESHLYFVGLLHRWRDHWPQTREAYFGGKFPRPLLAIAGPLIRRQVLAQAHGQGLGRRPPEDANAEALADIDALEEILGDDEFFFGSPGVTDAIVYGALENARGCPLPGPVKDKITGSERWTAYLDRIRDRWWAST